MGKATGGRKIDTVFVLIIFSVFALSVLMVLMLGASVYKNMSETSRDGQDERTLLSYIWTQVKNRDGDGDLYIGKFDGLTALCYDEVFGDSTYQTVVYHYDGWVYELFYDTELEFFPEEGQKVMEIAEMKLEEQEYGIIKVSSGEKSILIYPRAQ